MWPARDTSCVNFGTWFWYDLGTNNCGFQVPAAQPLMILTRHLHVVQNKDSGHLGMGPLLCHSWWPVGCRDRQYWVFFLALNKIRFSSDRHSLPVLGVQVGAGELFSKKPASMTFSFRSTELTLDSDSLFGQLSKSHFCPKGFPPGPLVF